MAGELILVVDDNAINSKLLRIALGTAGYRVAIAAHAGEAMASLANEKPALILMDIQLPGMDGLELTRRLKADPHFQSIPIVAVTAYAMKGDAEKAISAGCDGYVSKPVDTSALPGIVQSAISSTPLEAI